MLPFQTISPHHNLAQKEPTAKRPLDLPKVQLHVQLVSFAKLEALHQFLRRLDTMSKGQARSFKQNAIKEHLHQF